MQADIIKKLAWKIESMGGSFPLGTKVPSFLASFATKKLANRQFKIIVQTFCLFF